MIYCEADNIRLGTHKLVYLFPGGRSRVDDFVPMHGTTPGNQGEPPFLGLIVFGWNPCGLACMP
jgi:hypothetical protein